MDINQKSINYIKSLAAETVSNAKSGHTGSAIGASEIMFSLFHDHMVFDPNNTKFLNRDRLVFSAGHVSALNYTMLHLFGYDISIDDLKSFRKCGSKTPGHPEYPHVPGIETTTGPLGQGVANSVGLAIAEEMMAAKFNTKEFKLFDNYTYCYAGDGCLMEGVALEACSLAGTLGLNKFILLYDDNNITIDGNESITNLENVKEKFDAMGFATIVVAKGNDYSSCTRAIAKAKTNKKPTIILFRTVIGLGTEFEGTSKIHSMPLPPESLASFKQKLGVEGNFYIPEDVQKYCMESVHKNQLIHEKWNIMLEQYKQKYPEKYKELLDFLKNKKINFNKILNILNKNESLEGRKASGIVLNEISKQLLNFTGGNADLVASTKANIDDGERFSVQNRTGRNICFGVREHAMGSICNGIALYSNYYVFDSTFLAFSNYMLPALKMRAMMELPIISVFSHDSIEIGEDGPTHQPIEQLGQIRSLVGAKTFRPANFAEVVACYKHFIENKKPVFLAITKSKINVDNISIEQAEKGGYVYLETKKSPEIQIIATGHDLPLAISVANEISNLGVRVISMPCEKLFDEQETKYKNSVLLKSPKLTIVIEASNDTIWYKYLNQNDILINVTEYQSSGKASEVYANAGFDKDKIVKQIKTKLKIK